MKNKCRRLFIIIGIMILLFLLSEKSELHEIEQKMDVQSCSAEMELSMDNGQRKGNWHSIYLYAFQKKELSLNVMGKIVRLMAVTILLANLFHMNDVLFLQGKGRVFVCFKSCVFYPAHFLCELFIRQKSDGKKRAFLS